MGLTSMFGNTGLCQVSKLRMSGAVPLVPRIRSHCSLGEVYLYLIYLTPTHYDLYYSAIFITENIQILTQCGEIFLAPWSSQPGKTLRCVIRFTPTVSLPPQSVSLLLSLSYSEGTSGGFSCYVSRHYERDISRFLTSSVLIRLDRFWR